MRIASFYRAGSTGVVAVGLLAACGPVERTTIDYDAAGTGIDAIVADAETFPDAIPSADATNSNVDVSVVITADNAYSFGYGDNNGINTYIQGSRAQEAGDIFNCPVGVGPEDYTVPAAEVPDGAYLYIVSWDDLAGTQGVIGQFARGGTPLYTGDPSFQVCATGVNLATSQTGPAQADVNAQIAICNAASGDPTTTSSGWVTTAGAISDTPGANGTLAVGQDNSTAYSPDFPIVCSSTTTAGGVDPAAHWMWYTPPPPFTGDSFHSTGTNTFKAYLIFRVPSSSILIP